MSPVTLTTLLYTRIINWNLIYLNNSLFYFIFSMSWPLLFTYLRFSSSHLPLFLLPRINQVISDSWPTHSGKQRGRAERVQQWRHLPLELTEVSKIMAKQSCVPDCYHTECYPYRNIHLQIREQQIGRGCTTWLTPFMRISCTNNAIKQGGWMVASAILQRFVLFKNLIFETAHWI